MDTALVKVGGRWRHRKSGGPPVGRVEPLESAGRPVAYSAGPHKSWVSTEACSSSVSPSVPQLWPLAHAYVQWKVTCWMTVSILSCATQEHPGWHSGICPITGDNPTFSTHAVLFPYLSHVFSLILAILVIQAQFFIPALFAPAFYRLNFFGLFIHPRCNIPLLISTHVCMCCCRYQRAVSISRICCQMAGVMVEESTVWCISVLNRLILQHICWRSSSSRECCLFIYWLVRHITSHFQTYNKRVHTDIVKNCYYLAYT